MIRKEIADKGLTKSAFELARCSFFVVSVEDVSLKVLKVLESQS